MADSALHEEILLLEAKIEEMNETIAMCRKAILVSKVALAARSGQLGLIRWRRCVGHGRYPLAAAAMQTPSGS